MLNSPSLLLFHWLDFFCKRGIMVSLFKLGLILGLVLFSIPISSNAIVKDDGYEQCELVVKKWALSAVSEVKHDKHELRDLLFFLHIPRTGGRTYFQCFLKKLYPNSDECPRSYDKLRFDPRKAKCRLLSTHDDYSMMSKLPEEKTSVVTVLRNPIDRVFSTYEFSVEVASRFLVFPNLTSMDSMDKRLRNKNKAKGVSTLDIWPWKYLVPWMRQDLFDRRDARKLRGQSYLFTNNSYDMGEILMPLHEYINDPIARDNVHNGATFQITGLTNNSYFSESHKVRHCVVKYPGLGEYVLDVAKKRLDDMLFVGLTENHKESATVFANVVGAQVISQRTSNSRLDVATNSEKKSVFPDTNSNPLNQVNKTLLSVNDEQEAEQKNVTSTAKLMKAYESCIGPLRKTQADRRVKSLKKILPATFTKEGRLKVPEALIQEIASLNSLDVELYKYAQNIFAKEHALVTDKADSESAASYELVSAETQPNASNESSYFSFYGPPSWRFMLLAMTGLLLLFVFLFVNARKRTSKVKL